MRQDAFLIISFKPQLIKSPDLVDGYKEERNNFQESFEQREGLGLGSRPFSI